MPDDLARDRPSRYVKGRRFFRSTVGRGPVPRHAWGPSNVREGQALALREGAAFFSVRLAPGQNSLKNVVIDNVNDGPGKKTLLTK